MRMIEVVIIEVGSDHMNPVFSFDMRRPDDKRVMINRAIEITESMGYKVVPNNKSGCNVYVSADTPYITITVCRR